MELHSFTIRYETTVPVLLTNVQVGQATGHIEKNTDYKLHEYRAIWDTGATHCVISKKVVQDCDLKPIGFVNVQGVNERSERPQYLIFLILPNKMAFEGVPVTMADHIGEADMLIGMDIISSGDFAISNVNNRTTFTFRIPSVENFDFVSKDKSSQIVSRNAPCPCGSGKKYKKCCGQFA